MFFRFAPMGKFEERRFERNWTIFVNPAFCAAGKAHKIVVWNRNCKIRSQGCFFVSPRWGKSKKRVLNAIGRSSSTRPFALLGKAHPKWWHETEIEEFHPKGVFSFRPDGKIRTKAFWTQLDDLRQPGFLCCLVKPTQNCGMKPKLQNSIARVFFRLAHMGKSNKGVLNAIGRSSSTRLFALLGKAHPKWWHETEIVKFDPKGFFMVSTRKGKVKKTCFERNWTIFVNPAFCGAWKS